METPQISINLHSMNDKEELCSITFPTYTDSPSDIGEYIITSEPAYITSNHCWPRFFASGDFKVSLEDNPFRFTFYDRDKEVGELTMTEDNKVKVTGDIDKSAIVFFEAIFREYVVGKL